MAGDLARLKATYDSYDVASAAALLLLLAAPRASTSKRTFQIQAAQ